MFTALNKLWSAVAVLTGAVLNLAGVLDGGAAKLRQAFALDGDPADAPRVLEHREAAEQADEAGAEAPPARAARNGRVKDRAAP